VCSSDLRLLPAIWKHRVEEACWVGRFQRG